MGHHYPVCKAAGRSQLQAHPPASGVHQSHDDQSTAAGTPLTLGAWGGGGKSSNSMRKVIESIRVKGGGVQKQHA